MGVFGAIYLRDFIKHYHRFLSWAVDKAVIDSLMHKEGKKKENYEIGDDVHEDKKHFPWG